MNRNWVRAARTGILMRSTNGEKIGSSLHMAVYSHPSRNYRLDPHHTTSERMAIAIINLGRSR